MLHYTRRERQGLVIGKDIIVTVVEVRADGQVRLGITAPREMTVDREEIHIKRKESENASRKNKGERETNVTGRDDSTGGGPVG
jgi:carbon storage regulator